MLKKKRLEVDIGRTLPHSVEAEQGVLGSMLISPREIIAECVEKISEEYFHVPAHQSIYTQLVETWNENGAIDLITFTQILRDKNLLDAVGGASFVTSLFSFVPTAANITYYLEIVREKYILRQIISTCTEGARRAYEEQDEVNALIDEVEQKILSVGQDRFGEREPEMKDLVMDGLEAIEKAWEKKTAITGIATGFTEFDRMTGGLQDSEMVVLAARPSMGKTALMMNMFDYIGVELGLPVGVFSLEMSKEQLIQRLLCARARINMQRVRDGFLAERDFPSLTSAGGKLAGAKIHIDDRAGITILELRAKARRWKIEYDIKVIGVDYLQLLKGTSKQSVSNREREIGEISSGLKGLAKELKIPVIVLAQLNRQPEARSGGRPKLSDLRESGNIEQDADLVGFLVRPEVYEDDEEARQEKAGEAELIIAKQRNGPIGDVQLTFLKEFTKFEDRARDVAPREGYTMQKQEGPKCSVWEAGQRIIAINAEIDKIKGDSANYDHLPTSEGGRKLKEIASSQLTKLAAEKTRLNQRIAQG